jgi:hypothetical protein
MRRRRRWNRAATVVFLIRTELEHVSTWGATRALIATRVDSR